MCLVITCQRQQMARLEREKSMTLQIAGKTTSRTLVTASYTTVQHVSASFD